MKFYLSAFLFLIFCSAEIKVFGADVACDRFEFYEKVPLYSLMMPSLSQLYEEPGQVLNQEYKIGHLKGKELLELGQPTWQYFSKAQSLFEGKEINEGGLKRVIPVRVCGSKDLYGYILENDFRAAQIEKDKTSKGLPPSVRFIPEYK